MENKGTNNMRKLLHTIAAVSALLTLSIAAEAQAPMVVGDKTELPTTV
jgi:hypothetical protein